jgi:hypothetical protein
MKNGAQSSTSSKNGLQAVPETITEDFCGIEPVTLPPEEEETRRPPAVDEEKIEHYYHSTNSAILGTVLALLFIGLVTISNSSEKLLDKF